MGEPLQEGPSRYAPPWNEEQGVNSEGRPNLDPLQMVDALANAIITRQWRKAFEYIGDLQTAVWAEAFREAVERGNPAVQELSRPDRPTLEKESRHE